MSLVNKIKKIFISLFILLLHCSLISQEIKINQKKGIFQNKTKTHITFINFENFKPDFDKVVLRKVTKVIIHNDKVFILDRRQSKVFVFNKKANYLYSIGRPGQGPGDLEYPNDFAISNEGLIYVINSRAKRIEVFSLNGDFQRRIELHIPKEINYSHPVCILVGPNNNIFIAYNLNSHLIDMYDSQGNYKKNIFKREDPLIIPGQNFGNSSQMSFFQKDNAILYFNYFTGIFNKIRQNGKIEKVFSVFDKLHNKEISKLEKILEQKRKKSKNARLEIMVFHLWSNYCIDKDNNIHVLLLLKEKNKQQKFLVLSSEGEFLYWTTIPFFKDKTVDKFFCSGDDFIFITPEQEIFFAKKKGG